MADVFSFRLGEILIHVYKDELGGETLRKTTRGMNGWRGVTGRQRSWRRVISGTTGRCPAGSA